MIAWLSDPLALWLIKASLMVGLGLGLTQLLGSWLGPSARHWTLAVTFTGLLALPLALVTLPALELAWLPQQVAELDQPVTRVPQSRPAGVPLAELAAPVGDSAPAVSRTLSRISWGSVIAAAYLAVAGLLLLRLLAGIQRLARMTLRSEPLDPKLWRPLLREFPARQRLRVVTSPSATVPMTWGLSRAVIVLPARAERWTAAELRQALLHERAHIERGDWLVQLLARVVCALYWFHPLVWLASRRLFLEAERACDDHVLLAGARSTDYAEQLLLLARRLGGRPRSFEAVTMARRGQLWLRIDSVLRNTPRRCPMTRTRRVSVALCGLFVLLMFASLALTPAQSHTEAADDRLGQMLAGEELTPLMSAVVAGDLREANGLLNRGADPDEGISGLGTPLILACVRGDAGMAELLLEGGADPNRVDSQADGDALLRTPLANAARAGNVDLVSLLVEAGAEVDALVRGDATALMEASEAGHLPVVELLLDAGAEVNRVVQGDGTALISAAREGRPHVVNRLLQAGAEPNRAVAGDGNPLIAAARSGDVASVEMLLDAGAEADAFVPGDESPLFHAVRSGNAELVQRLIDAGANVNGEIPGDGSALIVAARSGNRGIVELLLDAGARADDAYEGDGNALIAAAARGDHEMVNALIVSGADVNAGVRGDGNPLIAAAGGGHPRVVERLVAAGAEIDRVVPGDENALIRAAEGGHLEVVHFLLDQGADVNISVRANGEDRTALRMALRGNHDDVADLLRSRGAVQ